MGQKYKPFREFRTPFPLRDIRENPRSNIRACAAGDGAICSKNRKIVPYHGANPNTRNDARLRSPSPIMAPGFIGLSIHLVHSVQTRLISGSFMVVVEKPDKRLYLQTLQISRSV